MFIASFFTHKALPTVTAYASSLCLIRLIWLCLIRLIWLFTFWFSFHLCVCVAFGFLLLFRLAFGTPYAFVHAFNHISSSLWWSIFETYMECNIGRRKFAVEPITAHAYQCTRYLCPQYQYRFMKLKCYITCLQFFSRRKLQRTSQI